MTQRRALWFRVGKDEQETGNRLDQLQAWAQSAAAEAGTNGYMLNRRGREAGISERSLFTGPEARAKKYASEELLNWWETHPRPTEAHFRGEDTRIGYATVRGKRPRMTSEEEAWRERWERDIDWPIEVGPYAEAA